MLLQLCRVVLRCQLRRVAHFFVATPLAATLLCLALVAVPLLAWRASAAIGSQLGEGLAEPSAARLLVLAFVVPALSGGAAFAAMSQLEEYAGIQLAVAPVPRWHLVLAGALPLFAVLPLVSPLLVAIVLPAVWKAPGGTLGAVTLIAGLGASAACGALLAELAIGATRRSASAAVMLMLGIGAVVVPAARGYTPLDPVVTAISSPGAADGGLIFACLIAPTAAGAWVSRRALRPTRVRRHAAPRRLSSLLARAASCWTLPALVLARRPDIRMSLIASLVLGLGAILTGALLEFSDGTATLLGVTSALSAAMVGAVSVGGLLVGARWSLACAPRRSGTHALAWLVTATGALALTSTAVLSLGSLLHVSSIEQVMRPAATAIFLAAGSALLAGALIVWEPHAVGSQFASLTAVAAVAGAAIAAMRAGDELGSRIALPEAVGSGVVLAGLLGASVVLLSRRLRSG